MQFRHTMVKRLKYEKAPGFVFKVLYTINNGPTCASYYQATFEDYVRVQFAKDKIEPLMHDASPDEMSTAEILEYGVSRLGVRLKRIVQVGN